MDENDKIFLECLKRVSPGTALRTTINDLLRSDLGALIVFETPDVAKVIDGGFNINCRFTPQRLFELCKMDGAIVLTQDQRRIMNANVLLTPDQTIQTNETGTRHKAGERTSKQLKTLVVAVSERKKKTTLYLDNIKYVLRPSEEVFREISNTIQVLEKQREMFEELTSKLGILEISNLVSVSDVSKLIQRTEIILRHSEILKKDFVEAGKEGNLLNFRYKELIRGVEKKEEDIIRDYAKNSLKKTRIILENLTYEGLLDLDSVSRLILEKEPTDPISPRGYRFLSELDLTDKDVSLIVKAHHNLNEIISEDNNKLDVLLQNRSAQIKEEIRTLKEQIIEGRIIL